MTTNGDHKHELPIHRGRAFEQQPVYVNKLPDNLAFDIIPDGAYMIVMVFVGTWQYELTVTREELRGLATISNSVRMARESFARRRGIKVCERWRNNYENFLQDVGRKPSPEHSIHRINNDGDYEPNNVKWATAKEHGWRRRR